PVVPSARPCWRRSHPSHLPAGGAHPKAVRRSGQRGPDRSRLLPVARTAHSEDAIPCQPGQLTARPDRRQVTIYAAARTARSTRAVGWMSFALVALVLVPALA